MKRTLLFIMLAGAGLSHATVGTSDFGYGIVSQGMGGNGRDWEGLVLLKLKMGLLLQ